MYDPKRWTDEYRLACKCAEIELEKMEWIVLGVNEVRRSKRASERASLARIFCSCTALPYRV